MLVTIYQIEKDGKESFLVEIDLVVILQHIEDEKTDHFLYVVSTLIHLDLLCIHNIHELLIEVEDESVVMLDDLLSEQNLHLIEFISLDAIYQTNQLL